VRDPSEDELDDWMSRVSQGEREAFDPLFRALYPRTLRVARAKLAEDQATDAAQQILMKLFARAGDFEPGRPVLPWFYTFAANELRTLERQALASRQRTVSSGAAERVSDGENPERALLERELRLCLERARAELDEESAEAIRAMLGEAPRPRIPSPAFRKRVSRAYARLRLLLGGADGE
jgi:RNA polymerase sigma factor (sigma-70 family)